MIYTVEISPCYVARLSEPDLACSNVKIFIKYEVFAVQAHLTKVPGRQGDLRIRFRASDFGQVAKINTIRAKSKQASCAEMVLGSFVFLLV